ncbi:MAG: LysM peptidoglycan-binding domain-containing protein [Nitratireductor sp.]|nr:LysM peptidoglycan-binding domain-containing protein [Nitratireductor sp.]
MKYLLSGKFGAWIALLGGAAAAVGAGMAIKNQQGEPVIASLLSPSAMEQGPSGGTAGDAQEKSGDAEQVASLPKSEDDTAAGDAPAGTAAPSFDILRVERDGSVVVAGRAMPDAAVEILSGDAVVGSGKAGSDGDFAIVFDTPLTAGNHELVIRARLKDAEPVLSAETGIVSIPEASDGAGEVLALISKPGEATRVLQGTEAKLAVAVAPAASVEPASEGAAAGQPVVEPAEEAVEEAVEEAAGEAAESATAATAATEAPAAAAGVTSPIAQPMAPPMAPIAVQAVDVETQRMFVAGTGEPGARVRVYVDNLFKGAATIAPNGAYLVEIPESLAAGRHDFRADMIAGQGGEVAARAEVVVEHAPETAMAAAAKPEDGGAPETARPAEDTGAELPKPAEAQAAASGDTTATAPAVTEQTAAAGETAADSPEPRAVAAEQAPSAQDAVPVIRTGRSVIIRRGDNLWRISRRMLGEGRKYTVIFDANADQIRNPHLIYPGQVFDVPDEAQAGGASTSG